MRCTLTAAAAATASLAYQALATCPSGTDTYQVTMSDSFGDGWSGNQNNCLEFDVVHKLKAPAHLCISIRNPL
jgi:hypothetical protein